jgi:hypothetical protein
MENQPTPEDVKDFLREAGLTRMQAAELLMVSIHTVDSWTAPKTSIKSRVIPLGFWELLLLKTDKHPEYRLIRKKQG